jgi:hypothetical protein
MLARELLRRTRSDSADNGVAESQERERRHEPDDRPPVF